MIKLQSCLRDYSVERCEDSIESRQVAGEFFYVAGRLSQPLYQAVDGFASPDRADSDRQRCSDDSDRLRHS